MFGLVWKYFGLSLSLDIDSCSLFNSTAECDIFRKESPKTDNHGPGQVLNKD